MGKSGFVLLAMGLGAVGVFVACSSSNNSGGSGGDGGASSGGYSLLNCPNVGSTGISSTCASCVTTNCSSQLSAVDTACAPVFTCACPLGADASACAADETQACVTQLAAVGNACTQCNSACGTTSSSSSGSSSGSSGGSSSGSSSGTTSSSSSSSGGASCDGGVDFTFLNVEEWCDITISGTIASSGGVATTSTAPSVSLCVQPDTTVTLTASPNAGFMLPTGFNDLLDGGIDPGTDAGGGAIQTTVNVGAAGNRCAWICCPGSSGSEPCTVTPPNCPE